MWIAAKLQWFRRIFPEARKEVQAVLQSLTLISTARISQKCGTHSSSPLGSAFGSSSSSSWFGQLSRLEHLFNDGVFGINDLIIGSFNFTKSLPQKDNRRGKYSKLKSSSSSGSSASSKGSSSSPSVSSKTRNSEEFIRLPYHIPQTDSILKPSVLVCASWIPWSARRYPPDLSWQHAKLQAVPQGICWTWDVTSSNLFSLLLVTQNYSSIRPFRKLRDVPEISDRPHPPHPLRLHPCHSGHRRTPRALRSQASLFQNGHQL